MPVNNIHSNFSIKWPIYKFYYIKLIFLDIANFHKYTEVCMWLKTSKLTSQLLLEPRVIEMSYITELFSLHPLLFLPSLPWSKFTSCTAPVKWENTIKYKKFIILRNTNGVTEAPRQFPSGPLFLPPSSTTDCPDPNTFLLRANYVSCNRETQLLVNRILRNRFQF